ncbi:uncharacterized protein EI97DRAFT_140557 [Westerdykella ornata]|uniref:Exonuclease V n=1 Tax=Westerdykella ornata TaxID=318751 RepID=A0A6A6JCI5_WESOR|nr:uncharacterized protein EI97DRAFT_140557 [Westerdykella ornata]KAF2273977.1 hypothetical protein EI97DRAFT_140557 [Westerdykella ornata]
MALKQGRQYLYIVRHPLPWCGSRRVQWLSFSVPRSSAPLQLRNKVTSRWTARRGHPAAHDRSVAEQAGQPEPPDGSRVPSDGSSTDDTRSPLERFRTKPQKPLSVTDLVSPAWCELQYWFVLTKYGRKPRTTAMKQGSKVHRELEEQVHVFVPVETRSNEDRFALRLWNTISGLRTLRETGLTRELEIWGVIEGQVVNGVIDELSYTSPDPAFEDALAKPGKVDAHGQTTIEFAFANAEGNGKGPTGDQTPKHTVYIADVKTRGVKTVPAGPSLRPTWMQLMLYRKLLGSLASNGVDADTVFGRYDLQPLSHFTDTFLAEFTGSSGELSELHSYNNLSSLWSLMVTEFSETVGAVSDILRAEFRYSRSGEVIGSELFVYDAVAIDEYTSKEMSWWKGKREAVGVEVEEAFKCRVCDFAEECTWRKNKIEEATEKHRQRIAARTHAALKG